MPCCFGLADASPPHWPDSKSWEHLQYDKQRYFAACFPMLPVLSNPLWCFPLSYNATAWVCWLLDDFRSFPKRICAFFGRPALSCPVKQTLCLLLDSPFAFKQSHTSKKISLSFAFVMMCFRQILLILCFVVFHGIQYAMILAFYMHLLSTYLVWHIDACILYPCFDNVLAFHELQTIQLPANCSLDA